MSSYKLVTYQSAKGPRAGVVVNDKVFDAAALTRRPAYASMLDILNDWASAKGTLKKAAAGASKSKLKSEPVLGNSEVWLAGLRAAAVSGDARVIKQAMKQLVPEYTPSAD